MTDSEKKDKIAAVNELLENAEASCSILGGAWDGSEPEDFAEAILGVSTDIPAIIYGTERVIKCFMDKNDWDYETAREWFEYNTLRAAPYEKFPPIFVEEV